MDRFRGFEESPSGPTGRFYVATPSDDDDLPAISIAIRAPSAGILMVYPSSVGDDEDPVPHPVLAGEVIRVRVRRIMATGTTVTGTIIVYA